MRCNISTFVLKIFRFLEFMSVCSLCLGAFDSDLYLEKFGYLDEIQPGKQRDEYSRRSAIETFQEFAGLPVTGMINEATLEKMLAPRCGLPDVIKPSDRVPPSNNDKKANRRQPLQFNAPGYKWDKTRITYKFVGHTRQLPVSSQRRAIRNAFAKWEAVTPLTFQETTASDADILINWVVRSHGDGSSFDGSGGTLAHAFFPGSAPISGDTHFDDEEEWTENTERGTNLEIVAAHELGHAIGLGHSNVRGALMQPFYGGYDANYKLDYDDIRGAQTLYGSRPAPQPTRAPLTRAPVTRAPPPTRKPPPTQRPSPTRQPSPEDKEICELRFDDIANGPDGHLYAFRLSKIYKFNSNGVGIESKFPRNVRKVFKKAPNNIGAAVYDRYYRKFYIFKGNQYWRYSGFDLDAGYPKRLSGWYNGIEAALQEDNGEIRVLKGSQMSVWREDFSTPPRGYPVEIATVWPGLRSELEAAVRFNRVTYFFKGLNYFKWNDYYRKIDYRKEKAGSWMGCGRVEPK